MRWVCFAFAALLLTCGTAVAAPMSLAPACQADGGRVALLIGNQAYAGPMQALDNPRHDVEVFAALLCGNGFTVYRFNDLTIEDFDRVLDAFSAASRGAKTALIYYSGHGFAAGRKNWLVPTDAKLSCEDMVGEGPASSRMTRRLVDLDEQVVTRLDDQTDQIIILDACRTNPIRGCRGGASPTFVKGLGPSRGSAGRLIVYATQDGQAALDGVTGSSNSPLMTAMTERLSAKPKQDWVMAMLDVSRDVARLTHQRQLPNLDVSLPPQGCLATDCQPDVTRPSENAAGVMAFIASRDDRAVLQQFLTYPDPAVQQAARARLEALTASQSQAAEPQERPVVAETPPPPVPLPPPAPAPPPVPMPPERAVADAEVIAPTPPPKPQPPKPQPSKVQPQVVEQKPPLKPRPEKPKLDQVARLLEQMPEDQPVRHARPAPEQTEPRQFDPTDISRLLDKEAPSQSPVLGLPDAPPEQPTLMVSQRAGMLVDTPGEPQNVKTFSGSVIWRIESVSAGQGQPMSNAVRAEINVPDAKVTVSMVIKKNLEPQFPASHTIEFHFAEQPGNTLGPVKQINMPELRQDDAAPTGDPLIGVPVSITDDYFLVGLSRGAAEQTNLSLMTQRNWFDVSILLTSGKIAKVAFEKGSTGGKILDENIGNAEVSSEPIAPSRTASSPLTASAPASTFEPYTPVEPPPALPTLPSPFPEPRKIKTVTVRPDGTIVPIAPPSR